MSEIRLSINSKDLNNFLKDIKNFEVSKVNAIDKEIARATYAIQMKAKQKAPTRKATKVRRGSFANLAGTIDAQIVKGQLSGKVIARAHYAPYREFGTGKLVKVPTGYESYAMQFKGRGIRQVNSVASPFLIPSMEKEQPRMESNIKRILSKP
jgi:HK97 gp10 family phage protein